MYINVTDIVLQKSVEETTSTSSSSSDSDSTDSDTDDSSSSSTSTTSSDNNGNLSENEVFNLIDLCVDGNNYIQISFSLCRI